MTIRSVRWIAAVAGLLVSASPAIAVDWHYHWNHLGRSSGLGWSDGYHSREGCPTEAVGRRKYPGYPGSVEHGVQPGTHSWMPTRPGEPQPTSASQPAPSLRSAPIEPTPMLAPPRIDSPNAEGEPQLPSAMFRPTMPR